MSGHSKWSQIKHKKAIADNKKGAAFGKLGRAISVAARGNPDPAKNLRLKVEIERARAINMPSDTIERAIRRVAEKDAAVLTEVTLEFIGPSGAAIMAEAITDSSNRTINELKQIAAKHNARLVPPNSVAWMFRPESLASVELGSPDERTKLEALLEALDDHDDVQSVTTNAIFE